jgi:hypothetical protein
LAHRSPMIRHAAARALGRLGSVAQPLLQHAVRRYCWSLSLPRQRLAWAARRLLRRSDLPQRAQNSLS